MIDQKTFENLPDGTPLYQAYWSGKINTQLKYTGYGWFEHVDTSPLTFSLTIKEAYLDKIKEQAAQVTNELEHIKRLQDSNEKLVELMLAVEE